MQLLSNSMSIPGSRKDFDMSERVTDAQIDSYNVYLHEPSRPPSRGGNTTLRDPGTDTEFEN